MTHTHIATHCLVTGVFVSVKPTKNSVLTPREYNVSHHNSSPMRLHKIVSHILSTRSDQHVFEVHHRYDILLNIKTSQPHTSYLPSRESSQRTCVQHVEWVRHITLVFIS